MTDPSITAPCPSWCVDRDYEGTSDHPAAHTGAVFGVGCRRPDRSDTTVFVQPAQSARTSEPGAGAVTFAVSDAPPLFEVEPAAARSLAAALTRMADQLETG
jgi:hypothetical protein